MQPPDGILLQRFRATRDQAAFQVLVDRHLPLVYSTALRVVRSPDLARDVSQQTFIRLAQKAHTIRKEHGLATWLHLTARSLAIDCLRSERRRHERESKAASLMNASSSSPQADWEALAPVLDEALSRLSSADRSMILLRYYENRSIASLAASLGLSEAAASKRALRALEKLRAIFQKRGIATSASVLAIVLPAHATAAPVPAGLSGAITNSAMAVAPVSTGVLSGTIYLSANAKIALGVAGFLAMAWCYYDASRNAMKHARMVAAASTAPSTHGPARKRVTHDLSELEEIAKVSNLFERCRALDAMLSSLPAASYPEAVAKLGALGFEPGSGEFRILLSHWCQVDARAAYAFCLGKEGGPKPQFMPLVLIEWGKRDFDAAFAATMNLPESWSFSRKQALRKMLPFLAGSEPKKAFACLGQSMDKLNFTYTSTIAEEILEKNPGMLRELAEGIPTDVDRNDWLLPYMAGASFDGEKLPDQWPHGKLSGYRMAANREPGPIATADQVFVAEWISQNPEAALKCPQLDCGNLFHSLALADHDQAVRLAAEIPESAVSLREEIRIAISIADDPSSVFQPTLDE